MRKVMMMCLFGLAQFVAVHGSAYAEPAGPQVEAGAPAVAEAVRAPTQAQDVTQVAVTTEVGDSDCVYTGLCGTGGWRGSCFLGVCSCENWAQCYDQYDQPTNVVLQCGHYAAWGTCRTP